MIKTIWICIVLAVFSTVLWAQAERGVLLGTVTDPTGGVVPGALAKILNTGTNIETQVRSDSRGYYISGPLAPGPYSITLQAAGFKTWSRAVVLNVNQRANVDAALVVGDSAETVTVTGEAPLLDTQTSTLGNVRTESAIRSLPLNGRNLIQLVWLAPGVQPGNTSNLTGNSRGNQSASVNGSRGSSNTFLVDGIHNKENSVNGLILMLSPDAIEEFKVQTSAMDAQFGQSGGGIINVAIKRGTNQVRGSLFEFVRNSAFDAKNTFDRADRPIPPFKLNQFGATLGGPLVLPKLYNGHNRTFFFSDFQIWRQRKSATYFTSVPSESMRGGDFSQFPAQIFDPQTIRPDPQDPARVRLIRDPFADNKIPLNRTNPVSRRLIGLYPAPQTNSALNNIVTNPPVPFDTDQFDVRIDHQIRAGDSLFTRYSFQDTRRTIPSFFPPPAVGAGPGFVPIAGDRAQQAVVGWTHLFSPSKINDVRIGFSRLAQNSRPHTEGTNMAAQYGIPGVNVSPALNAMTTINISQFAGLGEGGNVPLVKINNNYQVTDTMTLIHGIHSFRFGVEVIRRQLNTFDSSTPLGAFTFNGQFTNRGIGVPTGGTGIAMADFLLGAPGTMAYTVINGLTGDRSTVFSTFVQDDIRLTSRLTVNLGLRYDLFTPIVEVADRMANFVPALGDLFPAGSPEVKGSRATVRTNYRNFGPRVGFALQLNRKTVLRAGYGLFYSTEEIGGNPRLALNAPFSTEIQFNADFANFSGARKISDGLPPERPLRVPTKGAGIRNLIRYRPYENPNPNSQQWNIGLQRELPAGIVANLSYVGSKGTNLINFFDLNQARPGPGQVDLRRPFPAFGGFANNTTNFGNSIYHSMQLSFEKRLSRSLAFLGSYTWAHSIDNGSQPTTNNGVQNVLNFRAERGNSDYDMRHRFVTSWTYELPIGKGKPVLSGARGVTQTLLGGWELNGVQYVNSGFPFTPVLAGPLSTLNGPGVQRPDRVGTGRLSGSERTPSRWFDASAFRVPAAFTFGNSGRNILTGPRQVNFDMSLFKNFPFSGEKARYVQFRSELFNVFNTPQYNNPNPNIGDPVVARITSTGATNSFYGSNRQFQFAIKLYF